jgi:multiple antibiotic resistance protein
MTDHWTELTRFGIGLFALLNPFTALPYVLGVASGAGSRAILTMAAASTATMICVLLAMHILGETVLVTLGTSLPSFQIGGGLIIVLTGLAMLKDPPPAVASAAPPEEKSTAYFIRLGVAPLGIPMLAGAGAITKVILETQPHFGVEDAVILGLVVILVCLISGAIIASSAVLMRLLGPGFFSIMTRLSGLVIVAVGFEVMSRGVMGHARHFAAG